MPRRTLSPGGKPFEFRTGVGGLPPLGGIFRAGDPATIPPNKHHMVINARITPSGLFSRPGMTKVFDTTVAECIDGITEDGNEQGQELLLYPGAPQGTLGDQQPLNAMTLRAIWPQGGDPTYSEFVAVAYGAPSQTVGDRSKVIEPLTQGFPFLFNGRAHTFMEMPKPDSQDDAAVALALIAMDLPERTRELASDDQRSCGTTGLLGAPDLLFPFGYPLGVSDVVFYPKNPFESGETISRVADVLVWSRRVDDPATPDSPVVREMLFMLMIGTADTVAVVGWDGVAETTIKLKTGLSVAMLPPLIGAQADGPFVMGSTDGTHGDYVGYLNDAGTWTELAKGLVYDYGTGGAPAAPGELALEVDHWGAYKETYSGRGIIAFQGLMKVLYSGSWIDGRGIWAFEMGSSGAWDVRVATFEAATYTAQGEASVALQPRPLLYLPVDVLNQQLVAGAIYEYEASMESRVYKAPYVGSGAGSAQYRWERRDAANVWDLWIKTVGGRLYAGGWYGPEGDAIEAALDLTASAVVVWTGGVQAAVDSAYVVTRGCLGGAP